MSGGTSQVEELRAALDARLAVRDRPGAVEVALSAVRSGAVDVEALYTRVLVPLLTDTGAAWQSGAARIWEEHFASATVRTIVEALYPDVLAAADDVPGTGRTVLLACPPQETHDLGLRMLADRLALVGWHPVFLGADTPVEEIAEAAGAVHAELVLLSAATHYNRMLLRETIAELKHRLPGAKVAVGGPAFAHDRTWPADELVTEAELGLPVAGWTHDHPEPQSGA